MQTNKLAASVIGLALKDYVWSGAKLENKKMSKLKRLQIEAMREECEYFLLGKTTISRHWFACYDVLPMTRKMLDTFARSGVFSKELRKNQGERHDIYKYPILLATGL